MARQTAKPRRLQTGITPRRRKFASYRDRLIAAGIAAELIGDVRSPAGLHIDAVTPEEIALSIMAEIVRTRRSTSRAEAAHG